LIKETCDGDGNVLTQRPPDEIEDLMMARPALMNAEIEAMAKFVEFGRRERL
jgi:hypothetical protein